MGAHAGAKPVGGYEHVLARRAVEFKPRASHAPMKRQGEREMARRQRQLQRAALR